jgi:cytochrome c-type biogenesis protein CcmF
MTLSLVAASVVLMTAILNHDFRFDYVIGYSSTDLPLIYLISAFWGGQQGTFLLWALMAALIGYPLFRRSSWEPATVMAVYTPTIMFLIGLMLDPQGNPFKLARFVPPDGNGLNPLLQDPWMATHPPMVFLGYAAMTVPAVLAFVALIRRNETFWLDTGLRWSLIGFISLGIGIILGGFWAYKVLGWGGFWGWDPVENASLVPWVIVTALIHSVLVQKFTGSLRRTTLALALGGYLTVLYATFLTRSGVLADFSVHSFPKGTLFRWLVMIMLFSLFASVWGMLRRRGPEGPVIKWNSSWPFLLTSAVVLFTIFTGIVLIGTSWPLLTSFTANPTVPGIPFYNAASLPLFVLLMLFLGVAPFSAWQASPLKLWVKPLAASIVLAVVATVVAWLMGGSGVQFLLLFLTSAFALFSNMIRFVIVARMRLLNTGAAIAHLGLALMLVGIVASSAWDMEKELNLPLGHPVQAMDRTFTYRGHVDGSEPKDLWRVAVLTPGKGEVTGLARMYRFKSGGEYQVMRNPAILRSLARDLYIAPLALETGSTTEPITLTKGSPVPFKGGHLEFMEFRMATNPDGGHAGAMQVDGIVRLTDGEGETTELVLSTEYGGGEPNPTVVELKTWPGTTLAMDRISVDTGSIQVLVQSGGGAETLIVSVTHKPLMNLLWTGTILLLVGCTVAAIRRYVDKSAGEQEQATAA